MLQCASCTPGPNERTSSRINLCNRTPRRIFASVMHIMMMRAPDHEALAPCFEGQSVCIGWLCNQAFVEVDGLMVERYWRHGDGPQMRYRKC